MPYNEQIFALAYELFHFKTKTDKSHSEDEIEDPLVAKMAERYAAELLLPRETLRSCVIAEFGKEKMIVHSI